MQTAVAIIVAVLASPVISAIVARRNCNKCARWEVAYWELRKAAAKGEPPPNPPDI